jgi:hypothetical protein
MAYGSDITEGLPYPLSNPVGAITFSANAEAYDMAFNDMPFFLNTSDEFPYQRSTAQYRKQQIDQSNEPGEQSISGWWVRAQSSFHSGSGIKFYDPSSGETIPYRFTDSKGVNVWEKGKVTLLKDVVNTHQTTGAVTGTDHQHPNQHVRSIQWSNTEGVLLHDEFDVDKISAAGTVTHFIDYISGTDRKVFAICDDGVNAYWITNKTVGGNQRLTMFKKPLTGNSTTGSSNPSATGDVVQMFQSGDIEIQYAAMEFVKDRIVLCVNNKVYELFTNSTSLPSPVYTNTNANYHYTSVAASGPAIYTAGHSGIYSTIQKYTLSTNGSMPVLTSAVVAAELPAGEIIEKIYYYLGYMMIGTNQGVRVAEINDQDGSLTYGPLIVETLQPVYDFAGRDHYVWAATGIGALDGGLMRIDLDNELEKLRFAYANDLQATQVTEHYTTGVAFLGATNRLAFCTAYNTTDGAIYLESATVLVPSGYITTGKIRYSTLESKVFKTLKARIDNAKGGIVIKSIDTRDNEYTIGNFTQGDFTPEVSISYPTGAQEYLSFNFTMTRSSDSSTEGPVMSGYQLKSLPAVPRQRLITYPLACYDREKDAFGNQVGHEGAAYEKLALLEQLENTGDTIRIEDYRTGESFLGIIEELQFINRTPTDKRFSGFGGILQATIRTI